MKLPLRLLRVGQIQCVKVGTTSVAVCRTESGVYAVENRCTHVDSSFYGGTIEGDTIRCPMHGLKFDLSSGEHLGLGKLDNLRTFEVTIENGDIIIAGPEDRD
jgi:nitrite reductase/ring-hydroxylating ferredoxin subunit